MKPSARINQAGKALAPLLSRVLLRGPLVGDLRLLEAYLAYLQGKGSGGGWDMQAEARVAASRIKRPDAIVFDVGAHHGEWSRCLLELLGANAQCRLFQFEPLEYNLSVLRSLKLPRTTIIEAAVSDRPGQAALFSLDTQSPVLSLHPLDAWSHVASLYPRRESQLRQYDFVEQQVRVVTIDEIIANFGIESVDFIKIDVEGSELAVLQGGEKALQSKRIRALTFEFGCGNINSRTFFHDFWDLLHGCGYVIERICPGGVLLKIESYYEDLEHFRGVSNYLATLE